MKKVVSIVLSVCMLLALVACSGNNNNQQQQGGNNNEKPKTDFPTKSIDMTIGFGAGISADIAGRKVASLAEKELGQAIVVTNRAGAGGAIGYQYTASQKPDGYNIVWNSSSLSTCHHQGNMDIDYTAFRSVCRISNEQSVIVVRADAPWQTFEEFIADAKARPGEITMGNGGVGSFNHLTAVAIENATGAQFQHIPFNTTDTVTGLLGGQIDALCAMAFNQVPHVLAGDLRMLVSTGDERLTVVEGVPTMKELGYDFSMMMYRGVSVPKDTPDEVVEILENAFHKAIETDDYKAFAEQNGIEIAWLGAKDFDAFLEEDDKFIGDLMEQIGLKG